MNNVTVIIPTHNYGRYIAETLDCLLQQTYPTWECLIIDDGSVDDTREVVGRYVARDSRFRYLYQACQGVSAARNAGLSQAQGAYVQFLDADDLLPARKLELHVRYLEQQPSVDIVYSDVRYFANDDQSQLSFSFNMANVEWLPRVDEAPNSAITHLMQRNIMPIQSPLSRAKLLAAVGPFDKNMRYCEDWDYWFRCAAAGGQLRFLDAPEAISLVRVHRVSASQNVHAMAGGGKLLVAKFVAFLKDHPNAVARPVQVALKRERSIDLIRDRQYLAGLVLFLGTVAQPNASQVTYRDVIYWLKATLFSPAH